MKCLEQKTYPGHIGPYTLQVISPFPWIQTECQGTSMLNLQHNSWRQAHLRGNNQQAALEPSVYPGNNHQILGKFRQCGNTHLSLINLSSFFNSPYSLSMKIYSCNDIETSQWQQDNIKKICKGNVISIMIQLFIWSVGAFEACRELCEI